MQLEHNVLKLQPQIVNTSNFFNQALARNGSCNEAPAEQPQCSSNVSSCQAVAVHANSMSIHVRFSLSEPEDTQQCRMAHMMLNGIFLWAGAYTLLGLRVRVRMCVGVCLCVCCVGPLRCVENSSAIGAPRDSASTLPAANPPGCDLASENGALSTAFATKPSLPGLPTHQLARRPVQHVLTAAQQQNTKQKSHRLGCTPATVERKARTPA